MVEGPGCTLNGEKIRARVQTGQKVKALRGTLAKPATVRDVTSCFRTRPQPRRRCVNCSVSAAISADQFVSACREMPLTDLMGASTLVSTLWAKSSSSTLAPEH